MGKAIEMTSLFCNECDIEVYVCIACGNPFIKGDETHCLELGHCCSECFKTYRGKKND